MASTKLGNQNKPHFERDKNLASLRGDDRWTELINKMGNGESRPAA
jgi:hypothetical protein